MPLVGRITATRERVLARDVEKSAGPFECPACGDEMILRKGTKRVHHFAHKPPVTCIYGMGETAAHLNAKLQLYDALSNDPGVEWVKLEESLEDGQRPDLLFRPTKYKGLVEVAIELQRSNLTPQEVIRRTAAYAEKGITILWLIVGKLPGPGAELRPPAWMKALHAIYFGRIFYYGGVEPATGRAFAVAYHLGEVERYIESAYNSAGEEVGGYYKTLKAIKEAQWIGNRPAYIIEDMKSIYRARWGEYPEARIWTLPKDW